MNDMRKYINLVESSNDIIPGELPEYNTEVKQLMAVRLDGVDIQFIKNPSETVQLRAVSQNAFAILYIPNPSERVKIKAVKEDGYAIELIRNPSEHVQLEAIRRNCYAIEFINDPNEHVQWEAVTQNPFTIEYIRNPSENVIIEAIKLAKQINNASKIMQIFYQRNYEFSINFWNQIIDIYSSGDILCDIMDGKVQVPAMIEWKAAKKLVGNGEDIPSHNIQNLRSDVVEYLKNNNGFFKW